jgi:hypothetical protein
MLFFNFICIMKVKFRAWAENYIAGRTSMNTITITNTSSILVQIIKWYCICKRKMPTYRSKSTKSCSFRMSQTCLNEMTRDESWFGRTYPQRSDDVFVIVIVFVLVRNVPIASPYYGNLPPVVTIVFLAWLPLHSGAGYRCCFECESSSSFANWAPFRLPPEYIDH